MTETMVGTKYSPTNPWRAAMAKEHTPSWGLLFLEHARELQQTVRSLHNRLFCIGCFKKAKDFFFVCDMYARKNSSWRMKTSRGAVCNLRGGAVGPSCKDAIFSQAMSVQGGNRCSQADGLMSGGFRSSVRAQLGLQWELRVQQ